MPYFILIVLHIAQQHMDIITQNFKNLGDMKRFTLFILGVISSRTKINKDTLEEAFVTSKVMKNTFPLFYPRCYFGSANHQTVCVQTLFQCSYVFLWFESYEICEKNIIVISQVFFLYLFWSLYSCTFLTFVLCSRLVLNYCYIWMNIVIKVHEICALNLVAVLVCWYIYLACFTSYN